MRNGQCKTGQPITSLAGCELSVVRFAFSTVPSPRRDDPGAARQVPEDPAGLESVRLSEERQDRLGLVRPDLQQEASPGADPLGAGGDDVSLDQQAVDPIGVGAGPFRPSSP